MIRDTDAIVVVFSKQQVRSSQDRPLPQDLRHGCPARGTGVGRDDGEIPIRDRWLERRPAGNLRHPGDSEIRKFYQHFHRVWPYWFYFCDLTTETLTMMTLCLMPNLQGFKRLGAPRASVEFNPTDLIEFIIQNFGPLNAMMERAGMSEMDIYHRTRDIFRYFKLPFDAGPPEG